MLCTKFVQKIFLKICCVPNNFIMPNVFNEIVLGTNNQHTEIFSILAYNSRFLYFILPRRIISKSTAAWPGCFKRSLRHLFSLQCQENIEVKAEALCLTYPIFKALLRDLSVCKKTFLFKENFSITDHSVKEIIL